MYICPTYEVHYELAVWSQEPCITQQLADVDIDKDKDKGSRMAYRSLCR